MEIEVAQVSSSVTSATLSQSAQGQATTSAQVETGGASSRTGVKPAAPPRAKVSPPIFLRKGANFVKISAECTRPHINYSKAVRVADDGIKIICPNVETFRSLNKYLVDNKSALDGARDSPKDRRRQKNLQLASNCMRPLGYPSRGPIQKRQPRSRPTFKRPSCAPVYPLRDLENFPALASNRKTSPVVNFRPAPAPSSNPWGRNQPPRAVLEPPREPARRAPPVPLPATATVDPTSFGDDIQTVIAVLRAVSSSEISEFAGQLQACRNVEEKLLVLVRTYARTGGTALYYSRLLHCCTITIPPLMNMKATGCRLAMTGHRTIVVVSVYLSSPKPLHRSDLRTLLALGMPSSCSAILIAKIQDGAVPQWIIMEKNWIDSKTD
ncbi:hypothetical protein EVAR_31733_1 [Eumeta japonica]|uniref:Uncharacterized protein n=1 Tax=Eumeta variegata TaxID=151549 RepID=A0A4C1YLJ5_EUMVA|nr:hypothetical protein EVAR_31733_1 [Eumeta japonica]